MNQTHNMKASDQEAGYLARHVAFNDVIHRALGMCGGSVGPGAEGIYKI